MIQTADNHHDASPCTTVPASGREKLNSSHVDVIKAAARHATSRARLSREELEDFVSTVVLRLLEDNGHLLKRFSGRSSFSSYVHSIVQNLWVDHVRATLGRFRPSVRAARLGEPALTLERLVYRDGLSLNEAIQTLRSTESIAADDEELNALFCSLPVRRGRLVTTGPQAHPAASSSANACETSEQLWLGVLRVEVNRALAAALASLEDEEQHVLRLRYGRGYSVRRIADIIGVEPVRIYRLFERVKSKLRAACAAAGLCTSEVRHRIAEISVDLPALDDFLAEA